MIASEINRTVGQKIQALRKARRWSQAELATRLGVSQPHLSQLERGAASLTVEQLVHLLGLFNVTAGDLLPDLVQDPEDTIQSALARLGASHLNVRRDAVPSAKLEDVNQALLEAILSGSPRVITATGPVILQNIDAVNLAWLHSRLANASLAHRLGWVVDNLREALDAQGDRQLSRTWRRNLRRAQVVLDAYRSTIAPPAQPKADLLDQNIRSKQSLTKTTNSRSAISSKWGIISALSPDDFARALEAVRQSGFA